MVWIFISSMVLSRLVTMSDMWSSCVCVLAGRFSRSLPVSGGGGGEAGAAAAGVAAAAVGVGVVGADRVGAAADGTENPATFCKMVLKKSKRRHSQ